MPIERHSVEAAVARILASKPFIQSERMRRFVQFVVERALAEDRDALKEYTIGREVFDRGDDYDPRIDSIVRVEARRLRKKLDQYYAGEGAAEPWRIRLPEGSYMPEWGNQQADEAVPPAFVQARVNPAAARPHHVVPMEAYGKLMEGRHFAARLTPDGLGKSISSFQEAVRIDPEFAAAYAGLAGSILQLALFGTVAPSMVVQDANLASYRALTLNPDLPAAHLWRGLLKAIHDWNWDEAEVSFQQALDLNPNLVLARVYYAAMVMCPQGRFDEGRAHLGSAALLDPASVALEMARGLALLFVGELPEADAAFRRCLELNREFYPAERMLARVMLAQGRPDEAAAALQRALSAAGNDLRVLATLGYLRGVTGDTDGARDALRRLEETAGSRYVPAFDRAMVHMGLGEQDAAGRLMLEAAAEHEPWLIMLRVDPLFQALAGTEAYQKLDALIFGSLEQ